MLRYGFVSTLRKLLCAGVASCVLLSGAAPSVVLADADSPAAIRKESEPPAELAKAIEEGRKLLAGGKTTEFLDRFVEPTAKQKLKDEGRWAEVVEKFQKEKSSRLKQVFDGAAEKKPYLSADGAQAEYHIPGQPGERTDVKFALVAGKWYLRK